MKAMGLRSIYRRKYRTTTDSKHSHPVADNLLQRNFTTDGPDKVWVSDITYIRTVRGWLYLTVVNRELKVYHPEARKSRLQARRVILLSVELLFDS